MSTNSMAAKSGAGSVGQTRRIGAAGDHIQGGADANSDDRNANGIQQPRNMHGGRNPARPGGRQLTNLVRSQP